MNRYLRFGLLPLTLAFAGSVRADDTAAAPADDVASVRADNKQLTDELASAWKESDRLKAELATAQATIAKNASDTADIQKQLDAAKAQTATPPPADTPPSSSAELTEAQDKLATSLRSYSVLQDENTALKASVDKLTSDNAALTQQLDAAHTSIASLQVQAAMTSQIDPLRTELRQAQDESSRLATENVQMRTRLAIQSPSPGSSRPMPLRPGTAAAIIAETPPPAAAAAPAAKTYVVAEGDTLTKISRKFYGSSSHWQEILNANHGVLKDEKSLVVGSTLKIP
ncbi:MAG TPA: LysM peptidoglycan-binding domain-containing protein [Opitutaceae bacterium]